ncbi:MAG: hypothetical protein M2R45_00966 [Verrucomicrobia subdivision 3 bacterium]|nr:hypothetical protein [Limisphaerales bacterium]MCS1414634.1 hypothetical protein [Limisphaerales bacterium]
MNQSSEYDDLLSIRWMRDLNEREEVCLERLFESDPTLRSQWEEDLALLTGVDRLPDVPVATNFTSQVMARLAQKVGGGTVTAVATPTASWLERLGLVPKLGVGFAVALTIAGFFVQHQRGESGLLVESLAVVTKSGAAPTVEELQNFEAIQMLAQVASDVDWELIVATE